MDIDSLKLSLMEDVENDANEKREIQNSTYICRIMSHILLEDEIGQTNKKTRDFPAGAPAPISQHTETTSSTVRIFISSNSLELGFDRGSFRPPSCG